MEAKLDTTIEFYLGSLQLQQRSRETVDWYRRRLGRFKEFMAVHKPLQKIADIDLEDARAFVHDLQEQKVTYATHKLRKPVEAQLGIQTIHGYVRALRAFASWLLEEGYTDENIFKRLKLPKLPDLLIEPLTEDEIRKVLLAIPPDSPEGVRNTAIINLFLDAGIRLSELVGLKLSDIDFKEGEMKVFGKGSRERRVPFGVTARQALLRYVQHYRVQPINTQETHVFLTVAGTPITKDSVEKVIQRIAARTGIERLHPHLLRHTFAVRFLINGGDVFTLQKILGHKSLEMTRRYVTLANVEVKQRHTLFSPMDRLGIGGRRGRPAQLARNP